MATANGTANGKQKAQSFSGRRVRGYRRPMDTYYLLHPALREGKFSPYDVPAMMMDDAVLIGLSAIYGAVAGATFEVRANSPEIKAFVENTLFRFWHHDLAKVLHHYVPWGTFAGESMYEQDRDTGLWRYAGVDDFDIRDVQPWKRGRHLSKFRVSPGGMGIIDANAYRRTDDEDPNEWNIVRHPKIMWIAHRPLCGNLRGHSALEASWGPWMEKCGTHGAISIRRLWAFANAFRGVIVKYPEGFTQREDGSTVNNQDIAREIAENWTTGGASVCPSAMDENGHPLWEIIDAKMNGEVASLLEYPNDLNRAIWRGMGVMDEVISAPDTGGSWSGRSGPLLIFLNSCDFRVKEIVTGFDVGPSGYTTRSEESGGTIRPLVMENFGEKAKYEIRPISLVPKPAEPGAGGTGAGGMPGQPPPGPGGSPMGPPPGQMDVPTQPAGGNPIKLSAGDDGSVELPDAEVESILSGVQLSATGTMSVKPIKQAQPAKAAEASTPKAPAQTKPPFTGTITDSLNREYHFVDGVRVPGPQEVQQRQQAGQSVQNIKHDAEHTEESAQAHAASVPQQPQQTQQSHKFKSTVEADAHGDRIIQGVQLRPHEQAAVQKYRSTDTCYRVNSYLRGQGKFLDRLFGLPSEAKNMMEDLDATIKKSTITEPVTLMRGFRLEPNENPLEKLKPGTTFSDNGYVSTTLAEDVAKKFSISSYQHRVVMEIEVPKGANGYKMPRAAGQYDEAEVVMPRGSKFAITGIEKTEEGVFRVKAKYLGAPSNNIQLSAGMQPQPNGNAPANIERSDRFLWSMGDLQFDDPVQMSAGHDVSNVAMSASEADDNSTLDLANLYAHMWHGLTPEEVGEKELGTVHDELADGEHHLHWNSKDGWHVRHTSEDSDVQMSTKHAPKGGIVIAGKVFRGGMFIPNEDYQKATPEEKAAIDNPKEARADVRRARGSINHDTLQEKLAAHAHHELTKQELTSAKRSFNALHRHHGDLVLHRLEEIADMLQAAHDREGNTEGQTEQYSRRLRAVQHQIDFAKKNNLQGQVSVESQQKARAAHELAKSSKRSDQERIPSGQPVGEPSPQEPDGGPAGTGEGIGQGPGSVPAGDDAQRDGARGNAAGSGDGAAPSTGTDDGTPTEPRTVLNQTPSEESLTEPPTPENPTDLSAGNFRYTSRDFFKGGLKAKFAANVEAIRTLKALQIENRAATPEEQQIMSRYVGWGQFPAVFNDYYDDKTPYGEKERLKGVLSPEEFDARFNYSAWHKEKAILRSLLSDEEWASARRSTLNAHYTHPDVIDAHWKMAEKLGFKGGKFLETSAGIGYYMGLMPSHLAGKTGCSAVEMDSLTGGMLKHLYPSANVNVQGFQDFQSPDSFYDLVASNVPFGDYKVHDPKYNKHQANIHDYFFLKSLDKVRPGGLVMHITSSGTMDKSDSSIRKALAEGCELVSAVRFPSGAHKENAGTEVVTDMLILRKKHADEGPEDLNVTPQEAAPAKAKFTGTTVDSLGRLYHWKDGVRVPGPNWMDVASVPDPDGKEAIPVNKYFADHPEQILGRLDRSGTMYHGDSVNVSKSDDYEKRLEDAINRLPEGVLAKARRSNKQFEPESLPAPGDVKNGGYKVQDGKLFVRDGGALVAQQVNKKDMERIEAHLTVRDAVREVLNDQIAGRDASESRAKLNAAYDAFVAKHGILNDRANRKAFKSDPDAPVLLAIEKYNPKTGKAEKADIFSKDTIRSVPAVEKANTVSEALSVSLHETGSIDIARMSKLLGKSEAAIGHFLIEKGLAFPSPGEGWKPADQYLSGNVRRKLALARSAMAADPTFAANVKALEAVQPADIDHSEIDVKLGVPWIPTSDISEFAASLLQGQPGQFAIGYNSTSGAWNADYSKDGKRFLANRQLAREVWGTNRKTFDELLEAALNNTPVTVTDKDSEGNSIVNKKETDDANAKIQEIKDAFKNWVWEDDERRERLHRYYNDNFNNIVPMKYDGSHQHFPGMNPAIQLRDHQKSFVWQVVTTGKGLAAHEVGTGKTYSMITAAMELRRLGLAKKPAIACLKANIEAITNDALKLYPGARIISTADMFDAASRRRTISRIATGDYDMVILTHDNMDMLQMKPETVRKYIEEEIAELEAAKLEAHKENPKKDNRIVKDLEKAKQNLEAKLKEALDESSKDDAVFFEETGIDHLFVDEAHKYKTLPCYTKQRGLKGVPTGRSDRATSMLMRTRWLMEANNGRGVTFATGTPVANTMAELYNMQRYLQPEELKERGINAFDAWAKTFGDVQTKMEFTVSGQYKPVSRFAKFTNIPELMQMTGQVIDVQRADDLKKDDGSAAIIRPKRKDAVVAAPKSETMEKLMKSLQERAGKLKGKAEKGSDNMLVICTDGRKGAIDMRMLDASAPDDPNSKTNLAVNNVLDIHKKTPGVTQLIFSDIGVNPTDQGFHLYGDIISKLVKGGIPRDKIADFSSLEGAKKEAAMEAMRKGEILVGIGSTEKMGTGVNVQDKLKALHHLDVPWVPASLEQRDGRGWRQGNENKDVDIVRYVSEGSLDQTFWQIIGNKTRFIKQVMSGKTNHGMRVAAEEDSEELSPDQLMAAASGDPRILEKVNLDEDLRNLRAAENRHVREQTKLRDAVKRGQSSIEDLQRRASEFQAISKHLEENQQEDFSVEIGGKHYKDRKEAGEAFKAASDSAAGQYGKQLIGSYRGMKIYKNPNEKKLWLQTPSGERIDTGDALGSVEYVVRNHSKSLEGAHTDVTKASSDLEKLKTSIGKPFAKSEELKAKMERSAALEAELAKKNEEAKPAEPANEDPA